MLGRHIQRGRIPHNADAERVSLNRHIIAPADGNLMRAIKERIADGYKGGKAIRKDAIKAISLIMSGSHDIMMTIQEEGKLNDWVRANHDWLKKKYGEKNIVQLSLHMDERTPHLHAVIVPLTADGRLSAKEIVGNKRDLEKLQDEYHQTMLMNGYTFRRGIRGNNVRHTDINDYYRSLELVKEQRRDIMSSLAFLNPGEKIKALTALLTDELMTLTQKKTNEAKKDNLNPFKRPKRDSGMEI